jgi:large subunit ribosomal protein L18
MIEGPSTEGTREEITMAKTKLEARQKRRRSIRKKIAGSAERPRLSVYRSLNHIYAQVIDDDLGQTLATASSRDEGVDGKGKTEKAQAVGKLLAERCKAKGVAKVVFDRNGYLFHGRVRAVAEAAREAGLEF